MHTAQDSVGNNLLAVMAEEDYALLAPQLERVPLPLRLVMQASGSPVDWVYFPEDGVVSVTVTVKSGKQYEVGLVGSEGMSSVQVVLGADRSPHKIYVQIAGATTLRMPAVALREAIRQSPTLHALLLRYTQSMLLQIAGSAVAAAGFTLDQRLARWLLMCHDRVRGDDLALTHEFMAMMLGTRRAGVTETLHVLAGEKLVRTGRGSVTVIDRAGLEHRADDAYGTAEAEYRRLIGAELGRAARG